MSKDIGFEVNKMHSWRDFGLHLLEREDEKPKRIPHQARVAYSNVTYNFDKLYGRPMYEDRKLVYTFELFNFNQPERIDAVTLIEEWLDFDEADLYDDFDTEYHFHVFRPDISVEDVDYGVSRVTITFKAYPFRIPNENPAYEIDSTLFPDIDGDGSVSAADASLIMIAAAHIGAGEPSGLTEDQERRADANRDGVINAEDGAIVLQFATFAGSGSYTNDPVGWTKYLNMKLNRKSEVI